MASEWNLVSRKKWVRESPVVKFRYRRRLQLLKRNQWLTLGKDVWRIIFTTLVSYHDYKQNLVHDETIGRYCQRIGDYDYVQMQSLRSVCRSFSAWITPAFCLGIIYMNPFADTSRVIERWKDYFAQLNPRGGGPTYDEPNPFFGRRKIYLRTKWKWAYNPKNREPQIASDDQVSDVWRSGWEKE